MTDNVINFKKKLQTFTALSPDNGKHMEILQNAIDIAMENGPLLNRFIDENGEERFQFNEDRNQEIKSTLHSWGYLEVHNDNGGS